MEIDQFIFKRIHKFYKNLTSKVDDELEQRTVLLEPLKPRLTILSRALTGIQNEIVTSEREGGWSGNRFYLPKSIGFSESQANNIQFYIFRVLFLSVQQKLLINWEDNDEHKISESKRKAINSSSEVLKELFVEYPSTEQIFEKLKCDLEKYHALRNEDADYSWLFGRWMKQNIFEFSASTSGLEKNNETIEPHEITTELDANPSDEITTVGIDQRQIEDNVVTNNFEKVETLSEFNGTFREMDGEDTLGDDEDALRELNLKYSVRVDDISHSVYKAEFVNTNSSIYVNSKEEKGFYLCYDEWNYKIRRYKSNFCKVYPKFVKNLFNDYADVALEENAKTKQQLFKLFAQVHNDYEKVNRVVSGEEIDLDALIDSYVEIKANRTPSDKTYTTKRKRKKDLSVLILMDTSLSVEGYTNNEHILSLEKTAVLLLGEALNQHNISFQVDAFSSRTRNNCSYFHIKTFNEDWSKSRNKIGAVSAEGYTRIGPALRHAGHMLEQQSNQRKWIILLSDGKPNDYDTYEGKYGVEDVKQAIQELDNKHINTFSLAIEAQAKYYLPQMFGHNNYNILPKPSDLPIAFGKFYKRIVND